MGKKELKSINNAFKSNWIAPIGPDIDAFEKEISSYIGCTSSCATTSGTAALHLALRILGIKNNDFVFCPSLTFSASANVILYQNAIPVFIDCDPKYWTIDTNLLEGAFKKYKPKALISVDLYGQSCDYVQLLDLCNHYKVPIIEDAAEALGSEINSKKLGNFGDIGVFSFNGNKIITTSGGGMLVSNRDQYVSKARFLSTQAREPVLHYEHHELGYNYRMSNLLAALGRAQLSNLDIFVDKRRSIFARYKESLQEIEGLEFLAERKKSRSNRWLTTMTIDEKKTGFSNERLIKILEKENIESRPIWKPMHIQKLYKNFDYIRGEKDISNYLFNYGICLPSGSSLTKKDQNRIIDIIISMYKK